MLPIGGKTRSNLKTDHYLQKETLNILFEKKIIYSLAPLSTNLSAGTNIKEIFIIRVNIYTHSILSLRGGKANISNTGTVTYNYIYLHSTLWTALYNYLPRQFHTRGLCIANVKTPYSVLCGCVCLYDNHIQCCWR